MQLKKILIAFIVLASGTAFAADDTSMIPPPTCGMHATGAAAKATKANPQKPAKATPATPAASPATRATGAAQ
jgi:hypothetical protein